MAHSVVLTWVASTDNVDGYNIYRGLVAGQETVKVNATPVVGVTFTDPAPLLGDAFYVAKSVLNGVESAASNEVETVILPAAPTSLSANFA
jgi:hypothetical protein